MVGYGRIGGIAGIFLTLLAAAACSAGSASDVTVATAISGTIAADIGGQGTAAAGVDVPVALTFTDHVAHVSVRLGQHVTKGQPLLTLDPQPLLANVAVLRDHLHRAESDLTRTQADVAGGRTQAALVPAMLDQEQTLESQVSLYTRLVAMAQRQSNTLTSPIGGEVLAVNVRPGQVATPGTTLVEIVDYHRITVTAELPVPDQPAVRPGDRARLAFTAVPGLALTGIVTGVSPGSVNSGTGFQVTIDAANTASQSVHPGYQAYVQVSSRSHPGAVVRRMAVLNMDLAPSMFVIKGGVAQLRRVRVGGEDGSDVEITGGIHPGEEYVLVGNANLANGDRVHVTGVLGALGGKSG